MDYHDINMSSNTLSSRGEMNLQTIMQKIPKSILDGSKSSKLFDDQIGVIDLSMAENWLLRPEVLSICKAAIQENFDDHDLNWPTGFWGDADLIGALANFFNTYFHPATPVLKEHVTIAPGAAFCLDALLYNICDPNEGVLVPNPYWNGYDVFFRIRSQITPVPIITPNAFESLDEECFFPALQTAYETASCTIKALVLSNPHNPLGRCYSSSFLEKCLVFCREKNIHLISDEVFAMSTFKCPEAPDSTPFTSVLALDVEKIGGRRSMVHVVWSFSKDLGCSGMKLGCTVTQFNDDLRNGLALAEHMNVSTLSTKCATKLLTSPLLPQLLESNSQRLHENYVLMTAFLRDHGIEWLSCNACVFLLAKIAPDATSWDDELETVQRWGSMGVLVGAGKRYHMSEPGWARICFAVPKEVLASALERVHPIIMP